MPYRPGMLVALRSTGQPCEIGLVLSDDVRISNSHRWQCEGSDDNAGEGDHQLELSRLVGLVAWRASVPDRASPVPTHAAA